MPEYSQIKQMLAELAGSLHSLPNIAGLEPGQYMALAFAILVLGRFLMGSPNRNR